MGINVIQAAAPDGVSGNVQIRAPALDIAGSLRGLSTEVISPLSWAESCAASAHRAR
jgi:hypothetical protein